MKYIVGLTGGIASGKSLIASLFEKKGIDMADADQSARHVVAPGTEAFDIIKRHFGWDVIQEDGRLNRKRLRNIIFSDPTEKAWLEQLLHPLIREHLQTRISTFTSPYGILISPLLMETDQHELVNRILVVDAPDSLRLTRAMERDASTKAQIKAIIRSQMSREDRIKKANDIIDNSTSIETLHKQVNRLHQQYLTYG